MKLPPNILRFPSLITATACALSVLPLSAVADTTWTPTDLGDRLWVEWCAEDLPTGVVSNWTSRVGNVQAVQGTLANQPSMQNGEVFFGNAQRLTFPLQGQAYLAHRTVMVLFRIDMTLHSGGGSIFAVNDVTTSVGARQPFIGYSRDTGTITVQWATPGNVNGLNFVVGSDPNQWHCLVSRRVGNIHYASLDGKQVDGVTAGESQVTMADWAMPTSNATVGYIGDFRTSTPNMAIDTILLAQDEISADEAAKMMAWGMWRRGVQSQLPASNPYRTTPPPPSQPPTFTETSAADWNAMVLQYWTDTTLSEQYKGQPLNVAGWNLVFQDEFTSNSVTNDVRGKGNWFAPTHGAPCGAAVAVTPPYNSADPTIGLSGTPTTYICSGTTMTIRMQKSGTTWYSGDFCSVNKDGYGRSWMYPYIEARMKIGPSSTGNTTGAWPALWVKSTNSFFNLCQSYLEYDAYEGYISDPKGYHNTLHNWPAARPLPDRLQTHRYKSNYLGLKPPGWPTTVNLFDNQYHTYGVMVTPDWVINMFDGLEVFRFPTPVEMKRPLWILLDLALNSSEAASADGIYELSVDYVRVYQNPNYTP